MSQADHPRRVHPKQLGPPEVSADHCRRTVTPVQGIASQGAPRKHTAAVPLARGVETCYIDGGGAGHAGLKLLLRRKLGNGELPVIGSRQCRIMSYSATLPSWPDAALGARSPPCAGKTLTHRSSSNLGGRD